MLLALGTLACLPSAPPPVAATPALTPAQEAEWEKQRAEGKSAAQAFQWSKAREAYLRAWAIKQDWRVAANLGRVELRLSKPRDAAEHLTYCLREAPPSVASEAPEEWSELRGMIQKARAKVGALLVEVEPAGAEVLVNGLPIGRAPLPGPIFVDPGPVIVEARAEGFVLANASVKAIAGREHAIKLVLSANPKKE